MVRVRVSGPEVKRATRALYLSKNPSNPHQSGDEELSNGDILIHIRLGYKSIALLGLVVAQSIVTLLHDQFHVV